MEQCLAFGGGNSPTIYHLPASLLRDWTEIRSGQDDRMVIILLDDSCACRRLGDETLWKNREEYRGLVQRLGVRLASEDNIGVGI